MGNLIMSFMIALFAFQGFSVSFRISSFSKTVLNTPKNIFLTSMPLINDGTEVEKPYFDKTKLQQSLDQYYEDNLKGIVNDYQMSLYYYNADDDLMCKGEKCDGVTVTVTGNVIFNIMITKKMYYEVQTNI